MTNMASSGQTTLSATLNCPKCQTEITYYDVSGSSYYVCPGCHTFFKYENDEPPEILTVFPDTKPLLALPIGLEGYLNGQFVWVAGSMHKREAGTSYDWKEYVLLRQDGSTFQLAEYQGHWIVIEPTEKKYEQYHVKKNAFYVDTEARNYRLYNRYKPQVINAQGEFDWNILEDEQSSVSEYIQPPYMLIAERFERGSYWYEAKHITKSEVTSAFGLKKDAWLLHNSASHTDFSASEMANQIFYHLLPFLVKKKYAKA